MKSYVVAAIHGDEVFGLKVLGAIQRDGNRNSFVRVGHHEAVAKRKRYLETDLNRSFSNSNNSKEAMIAKSIQAEINIYRPECIIDIHTSVSRVRKVAIVAKLNDLTLSLAYCIGMESIVIMPRSIASNSLIGCYPDIAISLEFGKYQRSDKLATSIAKNIQQFDDQSIQKSYKLPVFKVTSTIPKNYRGLASIENLEFNSELGGYPFLAGKDTYQTIGGFLAVRIK